MNFTLSVSLSHKLLNIFFIISTCASVLLIYISSKGSADFLGINYYTSDIATLKKTPSYKVSYDDDRDIDQYKPDSWLG